MDKIPSIEELKDIIKGLRMSTFSFVECGAIDEVNHMIQALPVPEELDRLILPMAIKKIREDVGKIMRVIELYGKRDKEYKIRYKSRTGLPPRYKVLEWRSAMKKSEFVKEMIKVSSVADDKGNAEVATKLILFAKNVQEGKIEEQEVDDVIITLKAAGFNKEAQMIKEAGWMNQMWEGAKGVGKNIAKDVGQAAQGVGKNIGQAVQNVGQGVKNEFNKRKEEYGQGVLKAKTDEVQKDMANIIKLIQDTQDKVAAIGDPSLNELYHQLKYMDGIAAQGWKVIEEVESSSAPDAKAPVNVPSTETEVIPTNSEQELAEGTAPQDQPNQQVYVRTTVKDQNSRNMHDMGVATVVNQNAKGYMVQFKGDPATYFAHKRDVDTDIASYAHKKFNLKKFASK